MSEEALIDDQSHYEVSLTAGQAFLAFVLLLLSLAASFAFGLMIGRGQSDERLARKEQPAIVNEPSTIIATKTAAPAEQPVADDDFKAPPTLIKEESGGQAPPPVRTDAAPALSVPHYAQLLSSSDQKAAENLAAKLIDGGFSSAYVERGTTEKGPVFRVRVRFASEAQARASEAKLREFSKEVWITKQ